MWLITTVGFFSVVQKPEDVGTQTLTVRARVRNDLEVLKARYLPELDAIQESATNDYRYRASAPQAAVARAMAQMIEHLDYSNFKDAVAQRQGHSRSALYHDVWATLLPLQRQPTSEVKRTIPARPRRTQGTTQPVVHPKPDDAGQSVIIRTPSKASPLKSWSEPNSKAVVVPGGRLPAALNGRALSPWATRPTSAIGWELLAEQGHVDEPTFDVPADLEPAAGVVVVEPDGRIWLVSPTNRFGGYELTFPKGRADGKSLQATAICEAYEEAGLQVKLLRHLVDVKRTQTYTRYYLAKRIGGSPADMGWESQGVLLIPPALLGQEKLADVDKQVVQASSLNWSTEMHSSGTAVNRSASSP